MWRDYPVAYWLLNGDESCGVTHVPGVQNIDAGAQINQYFCVIPLCNELGLARIESPWWWRS